MNVLKPVTDFITTNVRHSDQFYHKCHKPLRRHHLDLDHSLQKLKPFAIASRENLHLLKANQTFWCFDLYATL